MLSRLCKGNKKAFLSPKIELSFVQGPFRPKINRYWSLYFSWLFLLPVKTYNEKKRGLDKQTDKGAQAVNSIRLESPCLIKSMRLQSKHLSKFRVSKNSKTYKKCLQSVETQYLGSALPKVNEQQLKIGECSRFFKIEKRAFLFPKIEVILGSVLF